MSIGITTMALLLLLLLLPIGALAKCHGCSGPGCGLCGTETVAHSSFCNNHGTATRPLWFHDTCGGCSQNNGDWYCVQCDVGYASTSTVGTGCDHCDEGYIGYPNCVLASTTPSTFVGNHY